jgi:hypothetical protein
MNDGRLLEESHWTIRSAVTFENAGDIVEFRTTKPPDVIAGFLKSLRIGLTRKPESRSTCNFIYVPSPYPK